MTRNRLVLLAGAVAIAAIAAAVLVVLGSRSSSHAAATAAGTATGGGAAPAASAGPLQGVQQHGDVLGNPSAPATLTVYEDPQCPYCRMWSEDAFPAVVRDFVKTGRVKLVYRGIAIVGPDSVTGLRAIYAAAPQNKLWSMVDRLYAVQGGENTGWLTQSVISDAARAVHADAGAISGRLGSSAVASQLGAARQDAERAGIGGTPSFVLQRQLGSPQLLSVSALDASTFSATLDAALR